MPAAASSDTSSGDQPCNLWATPSGGPGPEPQYEISSEISSHTSFVYVFRILTHRIRPLYTSFVYFFLHSIRHTLYLTALHLTAYVLCIRRSYTFFSAISTSYGWNFRLFPALFNLRLYVTLVDFSALPCPFRLRLYVCEVVGASAVSAYKHEYSYVKLILICYGARPPLVKILVFRNMFSYKVTCSFLHTGRVLMYTRGILVFYYRPFLIFAYRPCWMFDFDFCGTRLCSKQYSQDAN